METQIIKEFKKLKTDIVPDIEWAVLSREALLQKITADIPVAEEVKIGFGGYFSLFTQVFKQRLLEPAVVMILVLGTFLTSSLVINAAFYSLPGQSLYKVKLALEKTHAAMTTNDQAQVNLKVEFAQKRVEELDKIVYQTDVNSQEKQAMIKEVVYEFNNNVIAVSNHLNKLSQAIKQSESKIAPKDKAQTVKMAISVSSKAKQLAENLDKKIQDLPAVDQEEVKDLVATAVKSAQEVDLSAQQLVEGIDQPTGAADLTSVEVKGAANDENIDKTLNKNIEDANSDTEIKIEVKAQTVTGSNEPEPEILK